MEALNFTIATLGCWVTALHADTEHDFLRKCNVDFIFTVTWISGSISSFKVWDVLGFYSANHTLPCAPIISIVSIPTDCSIHSKSVLGASVNHCVIVVSFSFHQFLQIVEFIASLFGSEYKPPKDVKGIVMPTCTGTSTYQEFTVKVCNSHNYGFYTFVVVSRLKSFNIG